MLTGKQVLLLRLVKGLAQKELADKINVNQRTNFLNPFALLGIGVRGSGVFMSSIIVFFCKIIIIRIYQPNKPLQPLLLHQGAIPVHLRFQKHQ